MHIPTCMYRSVCIYTYLYVHIYIYKRYKKKSMCILMDKTSVIS